MIKRETQEIHERSLLGNISPISYGTLSKISKKTSRKNCHITSTAMDDQTPIIRSSQHTNSINLPTKRWCAGIAVLTVLTLERIAFYSLAGNMLLFLNQKPFLWMSYNAMTATLILTGVAYISSIFGGWLADSILGRFWTIFGGLLVYLSAYSVLPILAKSKDNLPTMCHYYSTSSFSDERNDFDTSILYTNSTNNINMLHESQNLKQMSDEPCSWLIYTILVTVGVGVGMVKTNLAPFGADQVREAGPEGLRVFFNWFYWCVNIGGLIAVGGIAYIQQSTANGFWLGYLIPTGCLILAFVIFSCGRSLFITHRPVGSIITTVVLILKDGFKFRLKKRTWMQYHSGSPPNEQPSSLDMAKVQYGGKFHESSVDDVKLLGKVLTVFLALVPYWLVYFQMQTTFLVQGLHMRLGPKTETNNTYHNSELDTAEVQKFKIPAAWLTLFDIIFLLIFIPLMDRVIYPCFDRRNITIPLVARITLGMFFAVLAMVVAGSVETYRLYTYNQKNETVVQIIGDTTYYAADMWIFWQIPQYSLIGLSEVFASVAGLEFAYRRAPRSMQSIVMGLFCLSTGVGSFLGTGLLNSFRNVWLVEKDSGNINYGHLDYYFYLLSGIQGSAVILFILLTKCCKNEIREDAAEVNGETEDTISNESEEEND